MAPSRRADGKVTGHDQLKTKGSFWIVKLHKLPGSDSNKERKESPEKLQLDFLLSRWNEIRFNLL